MPCLPAHPGLVPTPAVSLTPDLQSLLFHITQLPLKSPITENPTGNKSDHELPEGALKSDLLLLNIFSWVILFLFAMT